MYVEEIATGNNLGMLLPGPQSYLLNIIEMRYLGELQELCKGNPEEKNDVVLCSKIELYNAHWKENSSTRTNRVDVNHRRCNYK